MSTVPTLTVGGTDQTDFIHRKTLVVKLQSLDFTLVDPADDPVLHDTVSVDEPEWHGRVSTIESYPLRTAGGDDHRWVKVTCTNKVTADTDTAPFGLSDAPNMTTTFPYREFGYVQTLADQTDLATAEHRMTAIVYEPGLAPGMTVAVTNDAEGLAATDFIITEMTVEWLRDDVATYQISASVEGVPPVTLGDLFDSAGCDCEPFVCVPPDFTVPIGTTGGTMGCVVAAGGDGCSSSTAPGSGAYLYAGALYEVRYTAYHGGSCPWMKPRLQSLSGPLTDEAEADMGSQCHPEDHGAPKIFETVMYTSVADAEFYVHMYTEPYSFCEAQYSSIGVEIVYVSGPDPRFEDLPLCTEGPHAGQRVIDPDFAGDGTTTSFTTVWPYGANTLEVFVNGLDWTATITETDPTAGDYDLAYPYPLDATVTVRYRGA